MVSMIISSFAAYISTEIDDFISLILLMGSAAGKKEKIAVCLGKYAGLIIICGASILMANYISRIRPEFAGFLGLIPIVLAFVQIVNSVKTKFQNNQTDELDERKAAEEKMNNSRSIFIFVSSVIFTLASGFDNFAVYIPFFTTLKGWGFLVCALIFLFLQTLVCIFSAKVVNIGPVKKFLNRSQNILTPVVFILLGIYILFQKETLKWIFGW